MKTIGIIGGMSWESTALYYEAINKGVKNRLGGLHSAKIAMISVDFQQIETLQAQGNWEEAGNILAGIGANLKKAGADFLLLATNTMHLVAPRIELMSGLPLLHIADATAAEVKKLGFSKVGLLGTAFTMEKDFYRGRMVEQFGLDVITPNAEDRAVVHRIIYEELCLGQIREASRQAYLDIIEKLQANGAEAIILGCTEIGMLVKQQHTPLKLIDTTLVHADAAVTMALADDERTV